MSEVQSQILESAKAAGIIAADVADALKAGKRDRATALAQPALKAAVDRAGLGKPDLDRLLEKFWAQAGGRRAQLHRLVEEQLVAGHLVEASIAPEAQVALAEREMEERSSSGDPVRLLSILVDSGSIDENAARRTVTEVQGAWRFCKYCLSSWKGEAGASDACKLCGRPLTVAARSYEIVKLTTIAEDAPVKGVESAAAAASRGSSAQKPTAAPPPEAGETLAGVKLLEKIDDEGRGTIYKGERADDKTRRAVKVWKVGKDITLEDVARFETAALSATKLEHPGILKVFEAGEDRGRNFVVSEWVEGRSLKRIVAEKGPIAVERSVALLKASLEALEAAHKEKLLHKNVSPGNVIALDAGGVKIADFGVCKDYGVSLDTVRGNVIGSPDFLAPEQCQGLKSDERTDLFSVGATFYFALSGKKPFEGESTVTLIVKRLTSDPRPLRDVAPKVTKELADIIAKLMARKPDERFATARDALTAIQRWEARVEAGEAATEDGGRWKKVAAAVAGLVAMGLVATLAVMGLMQLSGPSERLLQEVAAAREMAEKGMLIEAAERLSPIARSENGAGPAVDALDDVGGRAIAQANVLAQQKNYPAAVSLLRRARPSVTGAGLKVEAGFLEAEKTLERKRGEYEAEAKAAYEACVHKAETAGDETAIKAWAAYRAAYPNQPLDDAAHVAEEKLLARKRQQDLMDEAESLALAGNPEEARRKLSDSVAMGALPESLEPRKRKVERFIDFASHVAEGNRLIGLGEVEGAVKEFQRAGEVIPDRPEVRQGIARAELEGILRRVNDAEEAGDLDGAVKRLREAEAAAAKAGLDLAPIRARRKLVEEAFARAKANEGRLQAKLAEGEKAFKSGDYRASLRAFRQAAAVAPGVSTVADGVARALAALGPADEEKAWQEAKKKAAKAAKDEDKANAYRDLVELYPDGPQASLAKEELLKLGRPLTTEGSAAAGPPKTPPLKKNDRGELVNPGDGSIMVRIPAGKYKRGTTPAERKAVLEAWHLDEKEMADEAPQREVSLDEFMIDVHETTNADYAIFLAALAADPTIEPRIRHGAQPTEKKDFVPKYWNDPKMSAWVRPELPVVGVDWFDAWSYAKWAGKRLLTEAEWERAARGPSGRAYPWGDLPSPFAANAAEAFLGRRVADKADWKAAFFDQGPWKSTVMTAAQSGFSGDVTPDGIRHLGGNVWEWCEDWYHQDGYAKSAEKNPLMTKMGELRKRVTRGGSWYDPPYLCRAASRKNALDPAARNFTTGFRCARSVDGVR